MSQLRSVEHCDREFESGKVHGCMTICVCCVILHRQSPWDGPIPFHRYYQLPIKDSYLSELIMTWNMVQSVTTTDVTANIHMHTWNNVEELWQNNIQECIF